MLAIKLPASNSSNIEKLGQDKKTRIKPIVDSQFSYF